MTLTQIEAQTAEVLDWRCLDGDGRRASMEEGMRRLLVASVVLLSACGPGVEVANQSTLVPAGGPGEYQWTTFADLAYPLGSDAAEATRMQSLKLQLDANGFCPDGFAITSRTPIRTASVVASYDLIYSLRCA